MGFPSEEIFLKFLFKTLGFLTFIKIFITTLLNFFVLPSLANPEITWPEPGPEFKSLSASIIQDMLPTTKFSDVAACISGSNTDPTESCAVCMQEFNSQGMIRRLTNCGHIFHKGCVDRWMDHDQRSCPLCRTPFIPYHLVKVFDDKLEAASSSSCLEFDAEFSAINSILGV